MAMILDRQLKKLELKIKNFEVLEQLMQKEIKTLAQERQKLAQEKLQFNAQKLNQQTRQD